MTPVSDGVLNALAEIHADDSEVCMMAKELIELRRQCAWMPIESAPKDEEYHGDEILLASNVDVYFGHWYKGAWYRRDMADLTKCSPTHWMPLPKAPE